MNETSDHALDFGREVITAILGVGCTGWTRGAATDSTPVNAETGSAKPRARSGSGRA